MNFPDYSLCWDTYSDGVRDIVQDLYKSDKFTDVTLVSGDKQNKRSHKIILSAVFKSIIENISEKNSVIYLKGVKYL